MADCARRPRENRGNCLFQNCRLRPRYIAEKLLTPFIHEFSRGFKTATVLVAEIPPVRWSDGLSKPFEGKILTDEYRQRIANLPHDLVDKRKAEKLIRKIKKGRAAESIKLSFKDFDKSGVTFSYPKKFASGQDFSIDVLYKEK